MTNQYENAENRHEAPMAAQADQPESETAKIVSTLARKLHNSNGLKAATTLRSISQKKQSNLAFAESLLTVQKRLEEVVEGNNLSTCEEALAAQAITLDDIFHTLARRAFSQENANHFDTLLKLAFKAQTQSRCSFEAISKIKNPPNPTIVKQQNVAHGHQQVNNNLIEEKSEISPNELMDK